MLRLRDNKLDTATARLRLPVAKQPYPGPTLARGIKLLYRRNGGAGAWVVRAADGQGGYWTKAFAIADDFEPADDSTVLDFGQAQDRAKALVRGGSADVSTDPPMTIDSALTAYGHDLTAHGGDLKNEQRVRVHMTDALLARPVMLLTTNELQRWRNGLLAKGLAKDTVNRTTNALRAALNLAADCDRRITNRDVIRLGLKRLGGADANKARFVVLLDADVRRLVAECYQSGERFGVLNKVLAQTGARMSQIEALNCCDLMPGAQLLMPPSKKGNTRINSKRRGPVLVAITPKLAAELRTVVGDRAGHEPLLLNDKGTRWNAVNGSETGKLLRTAVQRAGLGAGVTAYSYRHSSICRKIFDGMQVTLVAQLHDTSVKEIEAHYAYYLNRVAGDEARRGLLDDEAEIVILREAA